MITKIVLAQLTEAQRQWLFEELKRRRFMADHQKTAEYEAALRRRALLRKQGKDRSSLAIRRTRTEDVLDKQSSGWCGAMCGTTEDATGESWIPGFDGEISLEDLLDQLMNESTANILEFLALD